MTAPFKREDLFPMSLDRILTPDEFHQAQTLSPQALATPGLFPALPPVPKVPAAPAAPVQPASVLDNLPPMAQDLVRHGVLKAHAVAHALEYPFQHPLDFALGVVRAPVESFFNSAVAPGVGEARPNPNLSKGGNSAGVQLNAPAYDAEHGAVTDQQRTQAGIQSVVNAAAPSLGPLLGGAAAGAAYNPDDPITGAIAGAIFGKAADLGVKAVGAARGTPEAAPAATEPATAGMERTPEEAALAAQAQQERQASRDAVKRDMAASHAAVRSQAQNLRFSWNTMFQGAPEMAQAKGILRATTGAMAADYEQAAFKLDQFRRIINPLSNQQKLDLIDAIETGSYRDAPAVASTAAHAEAPITPHRLRMAQINGAMSARGGDAVSSNPYLPDSPLHDAWGKGFSNVPSEDIGAENVLQEHGGLTPQQHADLAEENQIAHVQRTNDIALQQVRSQLPGQDVEAPKVPFAEWQQRAAQSMQGPSIDPAFHPFIDAIRSTLDGARDQIRALGTGKLDSFIEDYFPHIWKDPERAADVFRTIGAKGPLEGPASFLKERSIPTTKEGIAQGLEPVSTNPIDLTLLKLREMQRYAMAHQSMSNLSDAGLTKYVDYARGGQVPDGYAQINDKISKVFGPRQGAVSLPEGANIAPEDVSVPGRRVMGEYWAPKPVADLLNNYLSPGLPATLQSWFPGPVGKGLAMTADAWRGIGNSLNQAQLGLSAFHLGFTSLDATTSRTALGLEYLASGKPVEGFGKILTAPVAALPGIMDGINHFLGGDSQLGLGAKIRAAYLDPNNASLEMRTLANWVQEAGGRVQMDSYYKNGSIQKFFDAYHAGQPAGAAFHALPALLELASKPIMEHIVPLQKLQVFGEMALKAMRELPSDASLAERRSALGSAWDSTDNRMGQLVYDNLFWNKTFKDLAQLATRSVGWNLGTVRELGGGVLDAGKYAKDLVTPGVDAQVSHRAAYLAALPITVGTLGAAYQYLRTGQGPQELKDYFYPRTGDQDADGNPERVQLPSYMKDIFAYTEDPYSTVKHKLNPFPAMVADMLSNQDFYGDEIRNPHDPIVKQMQQESEYLWHTVQPFGIRNAMESSARGDNLTTQANSFFGVTPAKRADVRTPAENLMSDYAKEHGSGGATPEMVEARQERAAVLSGLRGSKGVDLEKAVNTALQSGNLTPPQLGRLLKRAGMTPDQERFKALPLDEALNVFKISSEKEKAKFAESLAKKLDRAQR